MRRHPTTAVTTVAPLRDSMIRRFALLAVSGATLALAQHARAGLTALTDQEMSSLRGQAAPAIGTARLPPVPLAGGLLSLIPAKDIHASTLDKTAFETALAAHGAAPLNAPFYDGRPVTQITIEGAPVSASFEAGDLLLNAFGVRYQGPSFGMININALNASGTTLWVWTH